MKTIKLSALFLVFVMALAGTSASYALWFEDLTIDGTVNTGNVDVEWSFDGCGDNEAAGKDVSDITANIDGNTMTVTITNAYPCITYWVHFDIHCVGSIPVHFTPFVITSPGMDLSWITITPDTGYESIESTQLHTSEHWWGKLEIHLDNTAIELTTYTFTVTLMAHQYNEAP